MPGRKALDICGLPTAEPKGSRERVVCRVLRRAIVEQALSPDRKFPEDSIGAESRVSPTLVGEGMGRFSVEELVEMNPHRGASIACPGVEEARAVLASRGAVDVHELLAPCARKEEAARP